MRPCFYSNTITSFISSSRDEIFGSITRNSDFPDEVTQKAAWSQQIKIKEVDKTWAAVITTNGGNPASASPAIPADLFLENNDNMMTTANYTVVVACERNIRLSRRDEMSVETVMII